MALAIDSKTPSKWIREGLIYGVAGVLSRFTGVFLTPIYTRFMTPEEYGLLDLCTTLSTILMIVGETQMASGFMRSYYERKQTGSQNSLAGTVLTYYLISNLILWAIMYFWGGKLSLYLPGFEPKLLLPVLAGILPTQAVQLVLITMRLEHRPRSFLLLSVGQLWLAAILGILAVTVFKAGVIGVLWGLAAANLVFAVPSLLLCWRMTGIRFGFRYFREVFFYGAPLVPARVGSWTRTYASRLFIVAALSLSTLGVYSVSLKVASVFMLFTMAFRLVWDPYALKQYILPNSEEWFAKALNLYLFITFLGVVLVSSAGPLFVRILAPDPFWSAVPYVAILCVAYLWDGAANILGAGNSWARKTYYTTLGSLGGGFLTVTLLWWGIDRFGLTIVALSFWIGTVFKAMMILWTAQCNHHIPYAIKGVWATLFIGFAYSAGYFVLSGLFYLSLFPMMAASLFLGLLFQTILWRTLLGIDERAMLQSLLKGFQHSISWKKFRCNEGY